MFAKNLDCEPDGRPWYEVCTYINRETLARKPEAIRRYLAAIDEAIDFIRVFPDAARAMMPKHSSLDRSAARRMEIYHFLKSTEPLDFDGLNQDRASSVTHAFTAEVNGGEVRVTAREAGAAETQESAAITPEIYYCRVNGAGK